MKNNHKPSAQKDKKYKSTIEYAQSTMRTPQAITSKFIHIKFIEKTSDTIGSTIARPNALLAGGIFAFIGTLATYTLAKQNGFSLSGFESILFFAIGWICGIILDVVKTIIKK